MILLFRKKELSKFLRPDDEYFFVLFFSYQKMARPQYYVLILKLNLVVMCPGGVYIEG